MRMRTCVPVVVCVARKLRPCPSYSGRRDRNNSVHWRSLYKGGGGMCFSPYLGNGGGNQIGLVHNLLMQFFSLYS